jgi:hypothetical protein
MPRRVQKIKRIDPQTEEILNKTIDTETGGTQYGPVVNKGAQTFDGAGTHNGAETFNGAVTLAGNVSVSGEVITDVKIKKATPAVRLTGTEGSAKDWRIAEDAGVVKFQENTGSEGTPTWTTRLQINSVGLDNSIAYGSVELQGGDFTTSSTTFVDVTGASITITTRARRAMLSALIASNSDAAGGRQFSFTFAIDGADQGGSGGLLTTFSGNTVIGRAMIFLTPVLSAGAHTFKIRAKIAAGTLTVRANGTDQLTFQAIETMAQA